MVVNMTERIIDKEIKLYPYYRNDEVSLPWYQDLDVCKQVDNRDEPYDLDFYTVCTITWVPMGIATI